LAFRQDTVNAAGSDYWETRWYMARGEWSGSDRFKPTGGWVEISAGHADSLVKDGLAVRLTDFGRQSHAEIDSAFARGRTVVCEYKYTPRVWADAEYSPDSWPFAEDALSQVWETLTERERDICRMLRNGMTQDTIRESLGISQPSLSVAIGRIGEKYRRVMVG
jgi:DNA-binding NarL/FixJ family response regulator